MSPKNLPIFLYHGILECASDAIRDPLYALSQNSLEAQLDWLRRNGYTAISMAELLSAESFPGGAFMFTVDDCLSSAYTSIFPRFLEAGFRAVFFPVVSMIGERGWVGWRDLDEIRRAGMEIGSHSMTHAELPCLSERELLSELTDSRKLLEDGLGAAVRFLSLPGGFGDSRVRSAAAEAGYNAVCCSDFGYVRLPPDPCRLARMCIRGGDGEAVVRNIMKRNYPALVPRFLRERGSSLCNSLLGRRFYRILRRMVIPPGAHANLPRFPPSG